MNPWIFLLLNAQTGVKEFLFEYEGKVKLTIKGVLRKTWVVSVKADALPLFIWGCNNYDTKSIIKEDVLCYFIMRVVNQLAQYNIIDNNLIELIKELRLKDHVICGKI